MTVDTPVIIYYDVRSDDVTYFGIYPGFLIYEASENTESFCLRRLSKAVLQNMEDLVDNAPLLKCELVVAWYEFVLNREKLFLHLKKLRDDSNSKKLVLRISL